MPSDIPSARAILTDALKDPTCSATVRRRIRAALTVMTRDPAVTHGRVRKKKVTPAIASAIRDFHEVFPHVHQQDIAVYFGVNAGRVSEALNYIR